MTGLCCELSRCQLYIDFNQLQQLQETIQTNFRQETGQKDTIHNIFLSNYPVENVSTFCADSAHWQFYNKRLMKHALFIPRGKSNVLAKQISSLVNSRLERWGKKNLGAKADPHYKRTRVITRRVLTGLTRICSSLKKQNFMIQAVQEYICLSMTE